ncbi:MAG: DUF3343 domain-containing protein [Clostridiales bacterium]|nr:DUF3343 domain-containing protein [Clostridiales bacterium]OPZ68283.1 MAG: hypothetical protein BWY81_00905 [Firmicutes bacterium ADurb.Bin467]
MQEYFGIAAFRSRQQVLRFEAALKREGLPVRVISTPREVALGCGLSVQFPIEDAPAVIDAVNRLHPEHLIGVYRVEKGGGRSKLTVLRQ